MKKILTTILLITLVMSCSNSKKPITQKLQQLAFEKNYFEVANQFDTYYKQPLKANISDFVIYLRVLPYIGEFKKAMTLSDEWLSKNPTPEIIATKIIADRFNNYYSNSAQYKNRMSDEEKTKLINTIPDDNIIKTYLQARFHYFKGVKNFNNPNTDELKLALEKFKKILNLKPDLSFEPSGATHIYNFITSCEYFLKNTQELNSFIENNFDKIINSENRINITLNYYTGNDEKILNHPLNIITNSNFNRQMINKPDVINKISDNLKSIVNNKNDFCYNSSSLKLQALFNLGYINMQIKNYENAINDFEKIIQISPNYINANRNLSLLYLQKQDLKKAILCNEKILEINPKGSNKNGRTLSTLIQLYKKFNNKEKLSYWKKNLDTHINQLKEKNGNINEKLFENIKKELE